MTAPNTDARRFEAYLAKLAAEVKELREQTRTPQLGYSSLDDRTVTVTAGGEVRQVWGVLPGGAVGVRNFNGPPPPRPNTPDVTGVLGGLDIAWNGELAGELPADFSHLTVHGSFVEGFTWSETNRIGTLFSRGSLIWAPLEVAPHYVRFVAWNTSGRPSDPSYQASGTPLQVVSDEALDAIRDETAAAARDVAAAAVATAVIGRAQIADQAVDLSKLADASVSAAQIVANSITPDKVTFTARDLGSLATFAQPSAPGTAIAGDTWVDTDDANKLYRYSGTAWVLVQDSASALAAAQNAQSSAAAALDRATSAEAKVDGKVTVFYQAAAPGPAVNPRAGDLWLNTAAGNRLSRYDGTTWVAVDDVRTAQALAAAQSAQATADGKIDAYYQPEPPTGAAVGDLWYDTDAGNLASRWNGTGWVPLPVGPGALAAAAVTAPAIAASAVTTVKIAATAITAEKIAAAAVGADQLAANSVVAGKVAADAITAVTIAAGSVSADKIAAAAVSADKIAAGSVTAEKIAALAVTADALAANSITSTKIATGAITATHITASLLLASRITVGVASGSRVELEGRAGQSPGLRFYDANGVATFIADAASGSLLIRGQIVTNYSGPRIAIAEGGSNEIRFYPDSGDRYARLFSRPQTAGGVSWGGVWMGAPIYDNRTSLTWASYDAVYSGRFSDNPIGVVSGLTAHDNAMKLTFNGTEVFFADLAKTFVQYADSYVSLNTGGLVINSGSVPVSFIAGGYNWRLSTSGRFGGTNSGALGLYTNGVGVVSYNTGAFLISYASSFSQQSASSVKTAVEELDIDPTATMRGAPVRMWKLKADTRDERGRFTSARKRLGPMADDLPAVLRVPVPDTAGGPDVDGIDLGNQIAVAWAGHVQHADQLDILAARVTALTTRLEALETA